MGSSARVLRHPVVEAGAEMRIPGIPGASEPSFRTRGQIWVALDDLVHETCTRLEEVWASLLARTSVKGQYRFHDS